jgi:predicted alpha/beta superfamily hydrolase
VPVSLPRSEQLELDSRRLLVALPLSYGVDDRRYPVLWVLDADNLFCTVAEVSRFRALTGELAETIVVGLGYPEGTDVATRGARRTYDFTTADWDRGSPLFRETEAVLATLNLPLRIGGAPALLELLTGTLQPLVAERYRADAADQALFGHSDAGNFALYALFERPGAFAKVIAASPGLALNDGFVHRLEEEYARTHDDLPATLYLAAGSDEALQFSKLGIVSGTARLAETLKERRYPRLRLTCELLSGQTHMTALTEILQRGLALCWPGAPYGWSAAHWEEANVAEG